jgi:hypothetical protein
MLSQNNTRIPRQYWVEGFFFSLIVILGTFLRFFRLNARGFWGDEVWTAERSVLPVWRIITEYIDLPGPVYYLLAHFSLKIIGREYAELALRLPSAIIGSLLVVISYFCIRHIYNKYIAFAVSLLIAVCPYLIWYSQDARFYSIVATGLFVVWYAFRQMIVLKERKYWYLWVGASLFSLYTQPLTTAIALVSFGIVGVIYSYLNTKQFKSILPIVVGALTMAVGYSPVIIKVIYARLVGGWFGNYVNFSQGQDVFAPTLDNFSYHHNLFISSIIRGFSSDHVRYIFLVCACIGIIYLFYNKQWFDSLLVLVPFAVAYCIFVFLRPANGFGVRYVIFLQALYLLVVVLGIHALILFLLSKLKALKSDRIRTGLSIGLQALAILPLALSSLYIVYLGYYHFKPNDWRLISNYIKEHAQPGDVLIGSSWALPAINWYYRPSDIGLIQVGDHSKTALKYLQSGNRIWFVNIHSVQGQYGEEILEALDQLSLGELYGPTDILPVYMGYYPHSEIIASLFTRDVGYGSAHYFAEVPTDNPDITYRHFNPGDSTQIYLHTQSQQGRILQVSFLDGPDRSIRIQIGNYSWEIEGGKVGGWYIEDIELPDDLDTFLPITITSLGEQANGISFVRVIEPGSKLLTDDPRSARYFKEVVWDHDPDHPYRHFNPGDTTSFTLRSSLKLNRKLQISFLDGPNRAIRIDIKDHTWVIEGGKRSGWQVEEIELPDDLDLELPITITSLGTSANGISFVKIAYPNSETKRVIQNEYIFPDSVSSDNPELTYREFEPGDTAKVPLQSYTRKNRVLRIGYYNGPNRELQIGVGNNLWRIFGDENVGWTYKDFKLYDNLNHNLVIHIKSLGEEANSISYIKIIEPIESLEEDGYQDSTTYPNAQSSVNP